MQIIILHNQSLLDIAIQHTGKVENAFAIAVANGLSVSDELVVGQALELPELDKEIEVYNYYRAKRLQPATAVTDSTVIPAGRGIGWMQIGKDFKVS